MNSSPTQTAQNGLVVIILSLHCLVNHNLLTLNHKAEGLVCPDSQHPEIHVTHLLPTMSSGFANPFPGEYNVRAMLVS